MPLEQYEVAFGGHKVIIEYGLDEIKQVLDFMFADLRPDPDAVLETCFKFDQYGQTYTIHQDTKHHLNSNNLTDAANFLMGEVVYHLIYNNTQSMAIHAGLVSSNKGSILLPGESGAGKISLTMWMTNNGYSYHTDELVLINPTTLEVEVFPRPFNIKSHGIEAIRAVVDLDDPANQADIMPGNQVTMFSHRLLNPNFDSNPPAITRILFPRYDRSALNEVPRLTVAMAGIELMKTNVIARNLPEHGFSQLLSVVNRVPAYRLDYNPFDALPAFLPQIDRPYHVRPARTCLHQTQRIRQASPPTDVR